MDDSLTQGNKGIQRNIESVTVMPDLKHPLTSWFQRHSGWADDEQQLPENASAEGKLIIETWNAAIEHALHHIYADGNPLVARERIQELYYEVNP